MKTAIYYGPKDVRIEERPNPIAGPKDVVVKIKKAGICGSDITAWLYDGKYVGVFPNSEFGHEMVGVVDSIGSEIKEIKVGDRVFVNPTCAKRKGLYVTDMAGAFSEYVCIEDAKYEYNLFMLPDNVSYDEAVVMEPFCVGTHGKNVPGVKAGNNVVIYGAGTIGLCSLNALIGQGVKKPVIVDINDNRLALAKEMGATPFNPNTMKPMKEFLSEHFGTVPNPLGVLMPNVDIFVDCAGVPTIPDEFITLAKRGAKLSIVAVYKQPIEVAFSKIMGSEAVIMGSNGYTVEDIHEVIDNIAGNKTHINKIITHYFPQEKIVEAFQTASDPSTGALKVVIDFD
ncbi:MAG: zinc-binding dehydrogenase [Lachnotalea sp.]